MRSILPHWPTSRLSGNWPLPAYCRCAKDSLRPFDKLPKGEALQDDQTAFTYGSAELWVIPTASRRAGRCRGYQTEDARGGCDGLELARGG